MAGFVFIWIFSFIIGGFVLYALLGVYRSKVSIEFHFTSIKPAIEQHGVIRQEIGRRRPSGQPAPPDRGSIQAGVPPRKIKRTDTDKIRPVSGGAVTGGDTAFPGRRMTSDARPESSSTRAGTRPGTSGSNTSLPPIIRRDVTGVAGLPSIISKQGSTDA